MTKTRRKRRYTPSLTRQCPHCRKLLKVGYNVNWGVNWHHADSGLIRCADDKYPNVPDVTNLQYNQFVRENPGFGLKFLLNCP